MLDIKKQLWENQLWETVAFVAKAGFLFLLTPLMLQIWGKVGYGEFAIASSAVIFLTMFDLGMKSRVRVETCRAVAEQRATSVGDIVARYLSRFALIGLFIFCVVAILASANLWSRWLGLSVGQDHLIVVTTGCTELFILTGFLLEPLVANGRIGLTKMASAAGAITSIPVTWLVLRSGGTPTNVIAAWLGSLIFFNIITPLLTGYLGQIHHWGWAKAWQGGWRETFFYGTWFNITNAAWLLKNHGLTFFISALSGPATAGTFYIILRISETIGAFGVGASDVTLGGMASGDTAQRRHIFFSAYRFASIICLFLALGIGLLTPLFWHIWLKTEAPLGWATGWLAAFLGIASGLNRIIIQVAMPLGIVRLAAFWSTIGALLTLAGVVFVERFFGLAGTLVWTSLGLVVLAPVSIRIARILNQSFWQTWRLGIFPTRKPYYMISQ